MRFPNWGDAADLIDMIDVRSVGDGRYVSVPRADWRRPVVEGSQILGQMIVAAMRETDGRRAVSASIVLIRAADARAPLTFVLDVLSHGRTFSTVVGARGTGRPGVRQRASSCSTASPPR